MKKPSYNSLITQLDDLIRAEHCDGCDQLTCDISQSHAHGYGLWALYLFDSCGAASDEFAGLYGQLTDLYKTRFEKESERERHQFCDSVEHAECPHCNAVAWHNGDHNGLTHCDSCAKTYKLEVKK